MGAATASANVSTRKAAEPAAIVRLGGLKMGPRAAKVSCCFGERISMNVEYKQMSDKIAFMQKI